MFKFAFATLMVVSLYHNSFVSAKSLPELTKSEDLSKALKKISTDLEQTIKDIPKSLKWATSHLGEILKNTYTETLSTFVGLGFGICMRTELVTMADPVEPSHYMLPIQNNRHKEDEHRVIAKAVLDMWMDLRTMEKTDQILVAATEKVFDEIVKEEELVLKTNEKNAGDVFNHVGKSLFKSIDDAMTKDEEISDMYKQKKTAAKSQLSTEPKMAGPIFNFLEPPKENIDEQIKNLVHRPLLRKVVVNKMFMNEASKRMDLLFSEDSFNNYILAQSIIQWAKNEAKTDVANKMYLEAVSKASSEIKMETDHLDNDSNAEIMKKLNHELKSKIESDPTMLAELNVLQGKLRKHMVWDTELFTFKFLPF